MRLILASSSKQRQDIFNMIGLKYDVITSNEPEESNQTSPNKYVEELSLNKAKSVKTQINSKAIIISADTIIYCNNKIYEKPKSKEEAYLNLKELSNNKCTAYTGITLIDLYKESTNTIFLTSLAKKGVSILTCLKNLIISKTKNISSLILFNSISFK